MTEKTLAYKSTKKYFFRPRGFRTGFGRHEPRFVGCVLVELTENRVNLDEGSDRSSRAALAAGLGEHRGLVVPGGHVRFGLLGLVEELNEVVALADIPAVEVAVELLGARQLNF